MPRDIEVVRRTFTTSKGQAFQVTGVRIRGRQPKPVMTLVNGQHGMEHIGPVMLTRLADEARGWDFRGELRIIPCANPLALEVDYEFYPENEDLQKIEEYHFARSRPCFCVYGLALSETNLYNVNRLWNRADVPGVAGEITA
jgi:predicted deacylase